MDVRETINKNRPIAIGIAIALIAGAAGAMYWTSSSGIPAPLTKAYYSDDDGKTYFADETTRISPFDHDGKQAVRATVFRWGDGKPFVGYMVRLNEAGRKRMEELKAKTQSPDVADAMKAVAGKGTEYKRPGDEKWYPVGSPEIPNILNPTPPAGETGDLTSVDP